jgi:hypothetical protein
MGALGARPEFEGLARDELDETRLATPAISKGPVFPPTRHHLACVEPATALYSDPR